MRTAHPGGAVAIGAVAAGVAVMVSSGDSAGLAGYSRRLLHSRQTRHLPAYLRLLRPVTSSANPHLYVDISAHGLGHLAQTAPVVAALRQRWAGLRLTVASALPRERLAARIAEPFGHLAQASDFGFVMHNAVDIDHAASAERYRQTHEKWAQRVAALADALRALAPDLVLANAAYLPLAAAAQAGIASAGMCSLNWADLAAQIFAGETWLAPVLSEMQAAYNAADVFLRVSPGMPMPALVRRHEIGPIAALATQDRDHFRGHLATALALPREARWVLLAMGGMEFRLPIDTWPRHQGFIWLCPAAWGLQRDDVRTFDPPGSSYPFAELLAACDAVLTKPGYGTFVEAACNGVPVLYLPRDDWPEEHPLVDWMQQHGRIAAVHRADLLAGRVHARLQALWQLPAPVPPLPTGHDEAAATLACLIGRG